MRSAGKGGPYSFLLDYLGGWTVGDLTGFYVNCAQFEVRTVFGLNYCALDEQLEIANIKPDATSS